MITCSIIIVNYKAHRIVLDCLETIVTGYSSSKFELIVVDNFSSDDSEAIIKSRFPDVKWIQMGYNSGFARANNAGIRTAKGEIILLLNPDTLNENNAIEHCCRSFSASDYVACGVQLLNADRTPQISGNYFMKGGLNQLLPLPYLGNLLKAIATFVRVRKPNVPDARGIVEVDWINGAFLMVKRSVIEKAGLLDEDFFLYAEEVEWCSRLRKVGKLCIFGDYHVVHLQGIVSNDAFSSSGHGYMNVFDKKGFQLLVSNFLRIRKQFGVKWFLFHLFVLTGSIPVFFTCLILSKIFRADKSRYTWKQFVGFSRNVFGMWGYSSKMISNKPYFYKVL